MSEVNWGHAPKGVEFYSAGMFYTHLFGKLYCSYGIADEWEAAHIPIDELKLQDDYQLAPKQWPETDERISAIAQNGNDGLHYNAPERTTSDESAKPKSKYHRIIKGVEIDLYDVLKAYDVTCPALAHAIKKAMLPGARHAKSFEQDIDEAIASLERAKELNK